MASGAPCHGPARTGRGANRPRWTRWAPLAKRAGGETRHARPWPGRLSSDGIPMCFPDRIPALAVLQFVITHWYGVTRGVDPRGRG